MKHQLLGKNGLCALLPSGPDVFLVMLCSSIWVVRGYADEIHHKFVVSGHSYLSCDRDFAIIEKKRKKVKCEVPMDLGRGICNACDKNAFETTMMQEEHFSTSPSYPNVILTLRSWKFQKLFGLKYQKTTPAKYVQRKPLVILNHGILRTCSKRISQRTIL